MASQWYFHAFCQTAAMRSLHYLREDGVLHVPTSVARTPIELCKLGDIAELGPDVRDIWDGFSRSASRSEYPGLWGHESAEIQTIAQKPNTFLRPLSTPRDNRPLRDHQLLWERAGYLMVAERLRLNTHRLAAVVLENPALGTSWWPVRIRDAAPDSERVYAQALALWLNSTLGLMLLLGIREETEGAWVKLKKPSWGEMPVLDPRALSQRNLESLSHAFVKLQDRGLRPIAELDSDATRRAIDDHLAAALDLPPLEPLRRVLANEPILSQESLATDEPHLDAGLTTALRQLRLEGIFDD